MEDKIKAFVQWWRKVSILSSLEEPVFPPKVGFPIFEVWTAFTISVSISSGNHHQPQLLGAKSR